MRKIHSISILVATGLSFISRADTPIDLFSVYGFALPFTSASSSGVDSFSHPNFSAYTAAANPVLTTQPDRVRTSFQVAQSRFGFLFRPAKEVTGRFEFDFVDFSKSSPTTAALPRVRRAVIDYAISDELTFRFGQDWDIVSPLNPHTFNPVGNYFESGNIGFMRIQGAFIGRHGPWEHTFAIGLPGNNSTANDGPLELGVLPTFALREAYHLSGQDQVGLSILASWIKPDTTSASIFSGALTTFLALHPTERLEIRTEGYYGQNTYNTGFLGLAFGNASAPQVQEAGGYVTARLAVNEAHAIFAGFGGAAVLNPSSMLSAYSGGVLTSTGPGVEQNWTARIGHEWKPTASLTIFSEWAYLSTKHHLLSADAGIDPNRAALVNQMGCMLNF